MRLVGVGIDIVSIERVRNARNFSRVADFILTQSERREMRVARDAAQYLATRLAIKEAVIKAVPFPCTFRDIQIEKNGHKLHVRLRRRSSNYIVAISAAHEFDYAAGHAIVVVP